MNVYPNFVDLWRPHRFLLMKGNSISSLAWYLKRCRGAALLSNFSVHTSTSRNCFPIHRKCVRAIWTLSDHSQCLFNIERSLRICLSYTEHSYFLRGRKSMGRSGGSFSLLPVVVVIIATTWLWISGIWTSNHDTRQFQPCWAPLQLVAYSPSKKKDGSTCCAAAALE